MTEAELVAAFEDCSLPAADFHHAVHLQVAWAMLREGGSPLAAVERFCRAIRRFATHNGVPGLYHETITWAYLFLTHERMQPDEDFAAFRAANEDLFAWKPSILARYYTPETLGSEKARRIFVMPDVSLFVDR
jgi:hypothetical protein